MVENPSNNNLGLILFKSKPKPKTESNYNYDASEFFRKIVKSYETAKSWDQAGSTYIQLAEYQMKMDSNKHEVAGIALVDAAHCYKKISPIQAISCLQQAADLFSHVEKFSSSAQCCKEMGEIFEQLRDFKNAIVSFERATAFFCFEEAVTSVNQCKQKVAQISAMLKQYSKAIEIFEEMAKEAEKSNLLRYGVRGHLLNAALCHLCNGDIVEITNAIDQYQEFDATFCRTQECRLLIDLVVAYDEENVEKFTEVLKEYDSLSPLGTWKISMLLRIKANLKAKQFKV